MKTMEVLARKTLYSTHGIFEVSIDLIELSSDIKVFITVQWSVCHGDEKATQTFDLPKSDGILSGMKKILKRQLIAEEILFFADFCTSEAGDQTKFEICDKGHDISDEPIVWCNKAKTFI